MSASKEKRLLRDPRGGLTAAGRKHFAETEGAHLKPGVIKAEKDMTPEDMKRKGSFLRRHFGRKNPFRLVDDKGRPTRYALQAQGWGERLPKTAEDIQRLAAKGHTLLEKAARLDRSEQSRKGDTSRSVARSGKHGSTSSRKSA
jgi:hypothetical protein